MENMEFKLKKLSKAEIGTFPTPIHRLYKMENKLNYRPIYIKRDDLTGIGPGGNKIRSLEFILGDAIKKGKNIIIGSGPIQSNLCTLAAASCSKLGLKCILVHSGDEPRNCTGNVLLNKILNVKTHFIGNVTKEERNKYVNDLYRKLQMEGKAPYIIENGASVGLGAIGYVNASIEIIKQCREHDFSIKNVFVPGGNGGVAAGLIFGNALLGMPFKINIISVEDEKEELSKNIENIIREIEVIMDMPFDYEVEKACNIIDDYRGGGWGQNTIESAQEVFEFPKEEGIFIENVYNSKTVVGMIDMISKSKVDGGVCFLHTGGFGSLFAQF